MGITFLPDIPFVNFEMINELPNNSLIISPLISKNKNVKEILKISYTHCLHWTKSNEDTIIVDETDNMALALSRFKNSNKVYYIIFYLSEI